MKKFLAFALVCVMTCSVFAAIEFSSDTFKAGSPVLMQGNLRVDTWAAEDCALTRGRENYPVFLAFCQPCINCEVCEVENLKLNNATLYIVDRDIANKKVWVNVVPLGNVDTPPNTYPSEVSTYVTLGKDTGSYNRRGEVVMKLNDLPVQNQFGKINDVTLFGLWSIQNWFTGIDQDFNNKVVTATIGIIQQLEGCVESKNNKYWGKGTLSLRRDDGFTRLLMQSMTKNNATPTGLFNNPFLDCKDPVQVELGNCFQVMNPEEKDEPLPFNQVETYIKQRFIPAGWDSVFVGGRNTDDTWLED